MEPLPERRGCGLRKPASLSWSGDLQRYALGALQKTASTVPQNRKRPQAQCASVAVSVGATMTLPRIVTVSQHGAAVGEIET